MTEKAGVVVVAAGVGKRLGQDKHKALVEVAGQPLFFYCLEIFSKSSAVDEVVLVVHERDQHEFTAGEFAADMKRLGIDKVVCGGARRQDSVLNGLRALDEETSLAFVHDAARPFVLESTLRQLKASLSRYPGAVPVVPVASTVKAVDDQERVTRTVPRGELRLAQTPQAGRKELLIEALEDADAKGAEVTDDVQALERMGHTVHCVLDSKWNFKVTTPEDLTLARMVVAEGLHRGENA